MAEKCGADDPFPRIHLDRTNALELFIDFMLKNQPCIICASATAAWKSRQLWVKRINDQNAINTEFFINEYGEMEVPVIKDRNYGAKNSEECAKSDEHFCYEKNANCQRIKLKDYIDSMQRNVGSRDVGYAKDWHFQQESGTSYKMYGLPSFLRFDWINNEQWSNDERNELGDYRFVYFGVKDTWTPFHADVMSSYSWSANICGRKLWYFVPPGNEQCFRGIDRDTFLEDIRTAKHQWHMANVLSFIQEEGEIVFVPSNWYHQVHNLEDTVSINHNFINASNVNLVVELIMKRVVDVDEELSDCKSCFSTAEYNMYCEQILTADIRVNFSQLSSLLIRIINDRANDVDECWVCPRHRSVLECREDRSCLEFMKTTIRKACSCYMVADKICTCCLKFMKKFELSVAAECLAQIYRTKEERGGF